MRLSKEQRSVLAILAGLLIISAISRNYTILVISGVIAATLPFPFLNRPVHKFWTFISKTLNWISRHTILFLLFYFFLTPFSFLLRLFGKQTIQNCFKNVRSSFVKRNHIYSAEDFNNPW